MELVQIYECFCDRTRLRILHLLAQGPLCVCHLQEVLEESQVKISKHLAYLRNRKMVETTRHGNWMVYSLPIERDEGLQKNLRCLQDCMQTDRTFAADRKKLARLQATCCEPLVSIAKTRTNSQA